MRFFVNIRQRGVDGRGVKTKSLFARFPTTVRAHTSARPNLPRRGWFAVVLLLALVTAACEPAWPVPASGPHDDDPVTVTLSPHASADAAPRVLQLQLTSRQPEVPLDPQQWHLFRGKLGAASMSQLEDQVPSAALLQRVVPALTFSAADGAVTLVPTTPLDAGETYTLAAGEPLFSFAITIDKDDPLPLMQLLWPPAGRGAGALFGVWCLPPAAAPWPVEVKGFQPLSLQPSGLTAEWVLGLGETTTRRCVQLPFQWVADPSEQVVPPLLATPAAVALARLDPTPLAADADTPQPATVACTAEEIPFGPGCATVADDRLWVRSDAPRLWSIGLTGQTPQLQVAQVGKPLLVPSLPPASALLFRVTTIDLYGMVTDHTVEVTTLAPLPHVIINEVLANPYGPEPHQEWVELYNDGQLAAALNDYHLQDIGGDAWLPAVSLPAGGYALVVKDSFDAEADDDVMFPAGALVLRVPALGKNGLNNGGERLKLLDSDDRVVSRFPAKPKPVAGHSVSRQAAGADAQDAFMVTSPTPGAANEAAAVER